MRQVISLGVSAMALTVLSTSEPAHGAGSGQWPTYQHDFGRTGRADGAVAMATPAVAWTVQLGRKLGQRQAAVGQIDGSGPLDVVTIVAGHVEAHRSDGTLLWRTLEAGFDTIYGVWDLDGNGTNEVVVGSVPDTRALAGATGQVVLHLPSLASANVQFIPKVQGGLLVTAASNDKFTAYDTSQSLTNPPQVWQLAAAVQSTGVVADVDGDGAVDFLVPRNNGFAAVDPASGTDKGPALSFGTAILPQRFVAGDVNGLPGAEIISLDPSSSTSPDAGIRVVGWQATHLVVLWSNMATSTVRLDRDVSSVLGMVSDLDGDGIKELVYSEWDKSASTWATRTVDAATGGPITSIPGTQVRAIADLDGDGKSEILTKDTARSDAGPTYSILRAFDFDSRAGGCVAKTWSLSNARVVDVLPNMAQLASVDLPQPVVADFDPGVSGVEVLVGLDPSGTGDDTSLAFLHGASGAITAGPSLGMSGGLDALWFGNGLTQTTSQADLLMVGRDGTVQVTARSGAAHSTFPAGSFSNFPTVAQNDLGKNVLFVNDSRRVQRWLDGTRLDTDGVPKTLFQAPQAHDTMSAGSPAYPFDPVTYVAGDTPILVAITWDSSRYWLVGRDSTGLELWRSVIASPNVPRLPGGYVTDATGDGKPDYVVMIDSPAGPTVAIFNAVTGTLVRSTPVTSFMPLAGFEALVGTLVDLNGDSKLDLVTMMRDFGILTVNLQSSPMTKVWASTPTISLSSAGTIGSAPLATPGKLDIFAVNGNYQCGPYYRFDLDGTLKTQRDPGVAPTGAGDHNSVALVSDGTGTYDLVSTGMAPPNLSKIVRFNGSDFSNTIWARYAADGVVSSTPPTNPVALREPIVVDVDGNGVDDVVFGADDGYLYALRGDNGAKVFALQLGASAMHVIAANIDQDTAVELVASLDDGRLVAIDDVDGYLATRDQVGGTGGAGGAVGAGGAAGLGGIDVGGVAGVGSLVGTGGFGGFAASGGLAGIAGSSDLGGTAGNGGLGVNGGSVAFGGAVHSDGGAADPVAGSTGVAGSRSTAGGTVGTAGASATWRGGNGGTLTGVSGGAGTPSTRSSGGALASSGSAGKADLAGVSGTHTTYPSIGPASESSTGCDCSIKGPVPRSDTRLPAVAAMLALLARRRLRQRTAASRSS